MLRSFRALVVGVAAILTASGLSAIGRCCPFCTSQSQTFSEEIATMSVAVIAKLVKLPPPSSKSGDEIPKATFEVSEVIKGESHAKPGDKIETLYFGDGSPGKTFLVMGIEPPKIMWSTPLPLSERAKGYLDQVLKLPKEGAERLVFFQKYLEDDDEILARDAYDEFARAPYAQVKEIKDKMNHEQLVAWIKNTDIPASRRRLYLVMLGVCGSEKDLPLLEEAMRSTDRKAKSGLDALIACHLTLQGAKGLPLIDELFLANKKADYADTYAAIMALRFHGSEGGVIDKKELVKSLHHMLERPELADLVIPDLARWEDWGAMDKLFDLFKNADEKSSWVRVPVINYLRACPLPHAKELLVECEKIDPAAVKRANNFFPITPTTPAPTPDKASHAIPPTSANPTADGQTQVAAYEAPVKGPVAAAGRVESIGPPVPPPDDTELALVNKGASPAAALKKSGPPAANLWAVLGVPWAVGLVLAFVQWSVLRGNR
ncbi:MAG: hypothetical protein SFU86_20045 [Pirellulaceae bacterium]|nr:hypothetical protein [Pirellulaceae bacterium]